MNIYRNLNQQKGQGFVWSQALPPTSTSKQKGKIVKDSNGKPIYIGMNQATQSIILKNPNPRFTPSAMRKIHSSGVRAVACWVNGTPTPQAEGTRRAFSINPKMGEMGYVYSDTRQPVKWSEVSAVEFNETGSYLII